MVVLNFLGLLINMDLLGQNGQEGGVKMMKIVVEVVMMRMVILCVRIVLGRGRSWRRL